MKIKINFLKLSSFHSNFYNFHNKNFVTIYFQNFKFFVIGWKLVFYFTKKKKRDFLENTNSHLIHRNFSKFIRLCCIHITIKCCLLIESKYSKYISYIIY